MADKSNYPVAPREFPLALPRESTIGRLGQEANTRLINGYIEHHGADDDGKSQYTVYAAPGLTRFDSSTQTGAERGMIALNDSNMIALLGTQLCNITNGGVVTVVGAIAGDDRVTMARNMKASYPQIGIVTTTGSYYLLENSVLSTPTEVNLPNPNSITYVKGYFVYSISDGRIFSSPFDAGTGISATAFDYANSEADNNVRVYNHGGFLYVFGKSSFEIWQAGGTVPFPFTPLQQNIELGLLAAHSLAQNESGILWVDHKGIVRYGRDHSAQRVSTHSVERSIAKLSSSDQAAMIGYILVWHGHEYYMLTSSSWTWTYDIQAQRWFERKSYGADRWLVNNAIWFSGMYIAGSYSNGRLYTVSPFVYSEDSSDFVLEVWCKNAHNFPDGAIIDFLDIDIVTGVGVTTTTDEDAVDPNITIDYSDDGGKTFQGERSVSIGQVGDYHKLVRTGRWGRVTPKGRIWRFRASAAVFRGILSAVLKIRLANG